MKTRCSQVSKISSSSYKQNSNNFCEKSLRCYINNLTKKTFNQESKNHILPIYSSNPSILLKPYYYSTTGLTIKTVNFSSTAHSKRPQILNFSSSVYHNTLTPSPIIIKNKRKSSPVPNTLASSPLAIKTKLRRKTSPLIRTLEKIKPKIPHTEDQSNLIGWEMY